MSTLYRKYRPKLWSEIFGQESIKNTLKNEILNNKIAHAYIFSGSRGIGKTTTARLFAKTLNCLNRKPEDVEPCGVCQSCMSIDSGSSMELIEIDAASNTGVDDVRELRKLTRIPPKLGSYKIFIIDEVHMLSKQAFNALLKTLEEPPERVIFILATTEINKILDTILSRCQIFKFKKATNNEIVSDLKLICEKEKVSVSDEVLFRVAEKSTGGFRDAESLLGQILSSLNQETINEDDIVDIINKTNQDYVLNFANSVLNKNAKDCFNVIYNVIDDQINFDDFVLDLIEFFRKILIYKYNSDCLDNWKNLNNNLKDNIINFSKEFDFSKITFILEKLIKVKLDIKNSDIVQLPLEISIVDICELRDVQKNIFQKNTLQEDTSVLEILNNEPAPKLIDVVEKNGLLNHVDPSKREQMMKRFGLLKGGNSIEKIEKNEFGGGTITDVSKDKIQEDVSVFDILKDEFADNLE